MNEKSRLRVLNSCSGNLKSKIQNPKWGWSFALVVTFAMCGAVVEAQQQAKVAKIGWLSSRSVSTIASTIEFLKRELRALGYVEGKNIIFESRSADNKRDRLLALADEMVGLKVDLLVTPSGAAALALKNATRTIPIVVINAGDPVAAGLVDSLARPGGNVTGFTTIPEVLAGKRLELLKETVPKLSRVAVLWNPQDTSSVQEWKESQLPARELGLQLHSMEIHSANDIENAFKGAAKARSAALSVTQSAFVNFNLKQIADQAVKHRLAAIHNRGDFVESGGLMSYGPDQVEPYKRVVHHIDRILKGAKPADLPVEQPMKFEMVINFKTAKTLGLTIPPIVLMRATRVVK
jgi:putative ABC transport system substrate-binding protein